MIRCVRLKKPKPTCAYCFEPILKDDYTYTSMLYVAHWICEDRRRWK